MKKVILAALALSVSGCATAPPTQDKVSQVIYYAKIACQFEPTIALATSLINAAAGATVSTIGDRLCGAVTSVPLADGGTRKVRVYGVPVRVGVDGKFVKG